MNAEALVADAMADLNADAIPPDLRNAIEKHQRHLLSLAATLIHGGQPETVVRQTIDMVFQSYREELSSTILAIREREADNAT